MCKSSITSLKTSKVCLFPVLFSHENFLQLLAYNYHYWFLIYPSRWFYSFQTNENICYFFSFLHNWLHMQTIIHCFHIAIYHRNLMSVHKRLLIFYIHIICHCLNIISSLNSFFLSHLDCFHSFALLRML